MAEDILLLGILFISKLYTYGVFIKQTLISSYICMKTSVQ